MPIDDKKPPAKNSSSITPIPTDLEKFTRVVRQALNEADAQPPFTSEGTSQQATDDPTPSSSLERTDISFTILEAMIGLGLMTVGLATMVAVAFLPRRSGSWIFVATAAVFIGAGAWRIDRATRAHRRTTHRSKQVNRT